MIDANWQGLDRRHAPNVQIATARAALQQFATASEWWPQVHARALHASILDTVAVNADASKS